MAYAHAHLVMVGSVMGLLKQWGIYRSSKALEKEELELEGHCMPLDEEAEVVVEVKPPRLRSLHSWEMLLVTVRDSV